VAGQGATKEVKVGDSAEFRKTMTEAEQAFYTGIGGNMHPLYVNRIHATSSEVGERLIFELAIGSLAHTALAALGGPWMRLGQIALEFTVPARIGDTVAARAEVVEKSATRLNCRIECRRQDGQVVGRGSADMHPVARAKSTG